MFWSLARTLVLLAGLVWVALALALGGVAFTQEIHAQFESLTALTPQERYGLAAAAAALAICLLCPPSLVARGVGRYFAAICFGLWLAVPLLYLAEDVDLLLYAALVAPPILLAAAMIVWERREQLRAERARA